MSDIFMPTEVALNIGRFCCYDTLCSLLEALYSSDIDAQIQSLLVSVKDMKLDDSRFKLSVMAVIASSSDVRNLAEKTRDIHIFLRTAEDVDLWNYKANTFKLLEVASYDIFVDVFHALTVLPTCFNPYEVQCYLKFKIMSMSYNSMNSIYLFTKADCHETDMVMVHSPHKASPLFLNFLYYLSIHKYHYDQSYRHIEIIIGNLNFTFKNMTYMGWSGAYNEWQKNITSMIGLSGLVALINVVNGTPATDI